MMAAKLPLGRLPAGWVNAAVGRAQIGCLKNNFCRIEIFNYFCRFETHYRINNKKLKTIWLQS